MGRWITLAVLVAVFAALLMVSVVRAQEDSATIQYAENGTDPVATMTATDPEMDAIMWSIGGNDRLVFDISNDGVLTFGIGSENSPPDFEAPADTDMDNTYVVMVTATETANANNTDVFTVTVQVTNVNEPGR